MFGITLEDRLKRLLTPPGFFLGMVLGFVVCCVAGRKAPALMPITDFLRFHRYLSPESLYYPTALQVRALTRRELPREKIAVVIGGSSVMRGMGQQESNLWTRCLQQELGDEFRVLNLAMAGGGPNEYSQLAAEMLMQCGRKVIHVCDCNICGFTDAPDGRRDVYRYFFHDAQARGLLLPFAQRDRALAELAPQRLANPAFDEQRIQTRANRWLSFNDLWHVVGYEHGFFTWLSHTRDAPWQGRKHFRDPAAASERRSALYDLGLTMARAAAQPVDAAGWLRMRAQVENSVPEQLRPRTLVVVNRFNPEFLHPIDNEISGMLARYDNNLRETLIQLRLAGANAIEGCGTLEAADFRDINHLLPSGGNKLAVELAPAIRGLAQRLGYSSWDRTPILSELGGQNRSSIPRVTD